MFFIYHRTTAPTGRILAEALRIPGGDEAPSDREDVLIRWGSQARVRYVPDFTVNPAFAIARATDKLESLEIMRSRGVTVPRFDTDYERLNPPFLGRRRNHTRGQDIQLCMQRDDAPRTGSDYFVEYVPTSIEYRARVVGDRCVRVSQKVPRDGAELVPWIRNFENGYTFRSARINEFQQALAVAAVKAHGLHFGAVDMVMGEDGHTYVLEVNTAPALAPMSAAAMLLGIRELIEAETGVLIYEPDFNVLGSLAHISEQDGDTEDSDGEETWA